MSKAAVKHRTKSANRKDQVINAVLVGILTIGICLILYPPLSNYWNSFHQTRLVEKYMETVAVMEEEEYNQVLLDARAYNARIAENGINWIFTDSMRAAYEQQPNIASSGIMGYIEIPKIDVELPIFHGTQGLNMETAIGHLEQSSLPVGGEGSHCMLAGHRGLTSAMLFTNLDQMVEGDTFRLKVLGETLEYEVDQIRIVLPNDLSDLVIVPGQDLCTLITCTPYGINTHRLLVRGHRVGPGSSSGGKISYDQITTVVTADAVQIRPMYAAPFIGIPLLLVLLIVGEIVRRTGRTKD